MEGDKPETTADERRFKFHIGDILDPAGMVTKLQDAQDPLSQYLVGRFRPETRKVLDDFDGSREASDAVAMALIDEFNELVEDSAFYDPHRFEQVSLSSKTRTQRDSRSEGRDLRLFNFLLLEDAFPTEILRNLSNEPKVPIERVQTGVRIEKRMLKVLKALAEHDDVSLGEMLEDMVLHAFEGVSIFDMAESRQRIAALKKVYGMDYDAHAGPRFVEKG